MRKTLRTAASAAVGSQGFAGVACLAVGAYLIAGLGVGLVVLGAFLLAGAWATR